MNIPSLTKSEVAELLPYLTPQELAELDSLLDPQTISLTDFKRAVYPHYLHAPHLDKLDRALEDITRYVESGGREGTGRLIVEMPPRHGKSKTISQLYPAWHLGRNPNHRIIQVSYQAKLAYRNSRFARSFIMHHRYGAFFPGVRLARGSAAIDSWNIEGTEGGFDALGYESGSTGKGAHLLIPDDLIAGREAAESAIIRDKVWDIFTDDLYTRLEPGGAICMMATRWHMDDPIGRALKRMEHEGWVRIRLPAIAEANDPLGRTEGEALWSERYPLNVLRRTEKAMGAYSWSAEYQQSPVPAEGGIFKRAWFTLVDHAPQLVHTVRYWDLAMSEKTSADYTAGVKLGQAVDGHYYVLDVARRRVDWGDLTAYLADVMLADGPDVMQGIEEKGYMSRAVQNLNADYRLHGYAIFGYPVDKDKLTRALPYAAKCGAGLVHVVDGHWTGDYLDELCAFDKGNYDDQVDASSGAWAMLDESAGTGAVGYQQYEQYTIDATY